MAKKLKVGAVGTGGIWNAAHGPTLVEHPEIEIAALCDIKPEKCRTFAEKHEIEKVEVFEDYTKLLQLDLDFVDICTPNKLHSEVAVAALKAGHNVFCEKPDAIDATEAQRMQDAAEASGKHLMCMRNNRFRPDSQWLKRYIDAGRMGEIYTGRCGWVRRRGIPGKGGWFTTRELSGGGPLIDLGVHFIDLAVWLMGSPRPVAASGATYRKFAESELSDSIHSAFGEKVEEGIFDVEDLAIGFLRFENGATLQIEFSWASNVEKGNPFCELRGTKAGFSLGHGRETVVFSEVEGTLVDIFPRPAENPLDGHGANLHHWIDVLQGRAEPIFQPREGVDMIKILIALYESAEKGEEVKL